MNTKGKINKIYIVVLITLVLLCLAGVLMAFSEGTAYAENATANVFAPQKFTTTFDGEGYTITGFDTEDSEWKNMRDEQKANIAIVIPATYNGTDGDKPVRAIGENAFGKPGGRYPGYTLTSLDLSKATNLILIGKSAFFQINSLQGNLTIPDSVTTIDDYAFSICENLTALTFGSNSTLTKIGICAFEDCVSLADKLELPDTVTTIGESAFAKCYSFTSLTLPKNSEFTTIERNAFYSCEGLDGALIIPDSVINIGGKAFRSCEKLKTVYLPNNNDTIYDNSAFDLMSDSVLIVAANEDQYNEYKAAGHPLALFNLTYETTVTFDLKGGTINDSQLQINQDKLFNKSLKYEKDSSTKVWAINEQYELPKALKADYKFKQWIYGSNEILDLETALVSTQNYYAQYDALQFTTTFAADEYTITGFNLDYLATFQNKSNIEILIQPTYDNGVNGDMPVRAIGKNAFRANKYADYTFTSLNLSTATNLATIGENAFYGCSSLDGTLTIPSSVTTINAHAFNGCSSLKTVYLPDSSITYDANVFDSVTCPIVAANAGLYNVYKAEGHRLSGYNLTYETTVTFDLNGGKIDNLSENLVQTKLFGLNFQYEKDDAEIWKIDEKYALPVAHKEDYRFIQWNNSDSNKLDIATAKVGDKETYTAIYEGVKLTSITAEFTQGDNVIYPTTSLDTLKQWLAVTGLNNDGAPCLEKIEYTLSGTLTAGESNITVTANGTEIETTFKVTVTAVALESITAEFTQGDNVIYPTTSLDTLKQWLAVTGLNNDGRPYLEAIEYTLSGTLTAGESIITVTANGTEIETTFKVTVTAVALESITAEFTQGDNVIYPTTSLDTLKQWITVTGLNNDGTPYLGTIEYTLAYASDANALTEGVNRITLTVNGMDITTTFDLTVTASPAMPVGRVVIIVIVIIVVLLLLLLLILLLHRRKKNKDNNAPDDTSTTEKTIVADAEATENAKEESNAVEISVEPNVNNNDTAEDTAAVVNSIVVSEEEIVEEVESDPIIIDDDPEELQGVIFEEGKAFRVTYRRTFLAKLIQGDDELKRYYSAIKNEFKSFGVTSSVIRYCNNFSLKRKPLGKIVIANGILKVYLALDPNEIERKFNTHNAGALKKYAKTPCFIRVKTDMGLKKALLLIDRLMAQEGIERNESYVWTDIASIYPYETLETLIAKDLVKVIERQIVEDTNKD